MVKEEDKPGGHRGEKMVRREWGGLNSLPTMSWVDPASTLSPHSPRVPSLLTGGPAMSLSVPPAPT